MKVKSPIVDTNNCLNQVFSTFDNLNREISLGFHVINTFPNHFFFYTVNCKDAEVRATQQNKLENIYKNSTNCYDTVLIISDASVKNNITTLVSYIWRKHKIIMKTIHHVMNATSTEAELFAIRCGISQASQIQGVTCIVIVTDTILAAKRIFDIFLYLY